jgi:hypothetical protein
MYNDYLLLIKTSHSRVLYVHGDVTTAGEGLQNLGVMSVNSKYDCFTFKKAFDQGWFFIVPHLLRIWRPQFPQSHPEDRKGILRTYSNPDPHGSLFSRLLRQGDAEDLF